MDIKHYNNANDVHNGLSVVAKWMSDDSNLIVNYHNGNAINAEIFNGKINIPKMACSSKIKAQDLELLRGHIYHEVGHIKEQMSRPMVEGDFPKVEALRQCWNALEDRRMEWDMASQYAGVGPTFSSNNRFYNEKIANEINENGCSSPLWEALVSMGLRIDGISPAWRLSDKASHYVDAGWDVFQEVRSCESASDTLELANKLYDILKDACDEYEDESGEGESGDSSEGESGDSSKGESGDSSDGESGEGDSSDSSDGESGEGESGDSSEGESGDGSEGESGDSSEGESSDSSEGESGDDGSSGGKRSGKPTKAKGGDQKEPSSSDGSTESKMDQEVSGAIDIAEVIGKHTEDLYEELKGDGSIYTSRKDLDLHRIPTGCHEKFEEEFGLISGSIFSVTRSLEQSLRHLSKSRIKRHQKHGRIDPTKLVHISKSLSPDVFTTDRKGLTLDTAVAIIMDESGSMTYGNRFVGMRRAVMAIGQALSQIGVPFTAIGATTTSFDTPSLDGFTRTIPIKYNHYKSFSEPWGSVRHRMSEVGEKMFHNVDGEVVEYTASLLAERKESRKIVISLSDGAPCCGQGMDGELCDHLTSVCADIRKSGMEVYGFGIETDDPRKFYGDDFFLRVDKMDEKFATELAKILTNGGLKQFS